MFCFFNAGFVSLFLFHISAKPAVHYEKLDMNLVLYKHPSFTHWELACCILWNLHLLPCYDCAKLIIESFRSVLWSPNRCQMTFIAFANSEICKQEVKIPWSTTNHPRITLCDSYKRNGSIPGRRTHNQLHWYFQRTTPKNRSTSIQLFVKKKNIWTNENIKRSAYWCGFKILFIEFYS